MKEISIPNSVTSIGSSAFAACKSLTKISIPNSVTSIGSSAFAACKSLTEVSIPNTISVIEYGTFEDCSGLKNVILPDSLTIIGRFAFRHCDSLQNIVIPNSVTTIYGGAFEYCGNLKEFIIPNSVISLDAWYLLLDCFNLSKLSIGCGIKELTENDGSSLYSHYIHTSTSNLYFKNLKTFEVRDGNSGLYFGALENEYRYYCIGYLNILPVDYIYIGRELSYPQKYPPFDNNDYVKTIEYGGYCTTTHPMLGCESLKTIILGEQISTVNVSDICEGLDTIILKTSTPPVINGAFTNKQCLDLNVYVPEGMLSTYQAADGWKNFWNLMELDTSTSIEDVVISKTDPIEKCRYNIYGQNIGLPQKGLNIIRMSDGSTKKVLVK